VPAATIPETAVPVDLDMDDGGSGFESGGHDDFGGRGSSGVPINNYRLGLWFGLAAILMLFVAFTSAYIYREGLSFDWRPLEQLPILWFNTAVLLISSLTIEFSRRALRRDLAASFDRWFTVTMLLGITFLAGQYVAWKQLAARGIYLGTNPHSSFFYLLTSMHALHLMGGLLAMGYVMRGALRHQYTSQGSAAVDVTAIYWHFMDGLWVYLFLLLFLWR
jgi:cytochrome c oxidase subunit 3